VVLGHAWTAIPARMPMGCIPGNFGSVVFNKKKEGG